MPRPPRTPARRAVAAVTSVLVLASMLFGVPILLPGVAAADVVVDASRASAGARDVLITFRVTDADPAVPTTRLQVFLPTVHPLLGVRPTAPVGWTVRVGPAVGAVTWEGGTLAGTDYAVFPLAVDRLPDGAGPLRFRVVQTVASGATEEWSDLVPVGAPAPAHPALEIPYSTAPGTSDAASAGVTGPAALPAALHDHGGGDVTIPTGGGAVWAFLAVTGAAGTAIVTAAGALGRRQERLLSRRGRRP